MAALDSLLWPILCVQGAPILKRARGNVPTAQAEGQREGHRRRAQRQSEGQIHDVIGHTRLAQRHGARQRQDAGQQHAG